MNDLTKIIGDFCERMEEAYENKNWDSVREIIDELDCIHRDLERGSMGFESEY